MTRTLERGDVERDDGKVFGGRLFTLIGAAAFILIIGLAVIATKVGNHSAPAASATPEPQITYTQPTAPAGISGPLTAAPDVTWTIRNKVAFPSSAAAGTRTPQGALLAAANGWLGFGRDGTAAVQKTQIRDYFGGPAVPGFLAGIPYTRLTDPAQIAGFRQTGPYTPDIVTLDLAMRYTDAATGDTAIQVIELPMRWQGRWLIWLDERTAAPGVTTTSLPEGFIQFGGVA